MDGWVLWPFGSIEFSLDAVSAFFLAVLFIVAVPAGIYSYWYRSRRVAVVEVLLILLFVLSMCFVVMSSTVGAFMFCWELMAVASYLLIVRESRESSRDAAARAASIYIVMTHVSAVLMLCGLLYLRQCTGSDFFADWSHLAHRIPSTGRSIAFILVFIGLATKGGLVPFHIWLPRAHPEAPGHISAMMSAAMVNLALYGVIRLLSMALGPGPLWWGLLITAIGLMSSIVGALGALRQVDIKEALAFSTIENIGVAAMALGLSMSLWSAGYAEAAVLAFAAASVHIVAHAFFKSLLFMVAGAIQKTSGTRDLAVLGGLIKKMPKTGRLALAGFASASPLPGSPAFAGEFLFAIALYSVISSVRAAAGGGEEGIILIAAVITASGLALTSGLALAASVRMYAVAFLGLPRSAEASTAGESPWGMRAAMAISALGCVGVGVLGMFPRLILEAADKLFPFEYEMRLAVEALPDGLGAIPAVFVGVSVLLLAAFLRGRAIGRSESWNCGRVADFRMQYSARGYAQPFTRAFKLSPMVFLDSYRFASSVVVRVAGVLRSLQSGSLQLYMGYVLTTLIVLVIICARNS